MSLWMGCLLNVSHCKADELTCNFEWVDFPMCIIITWNLLISRKWNIRKAKNCAYLIKHVTLNKVTFQCVLQSPELNLLVENAACHNDRGTI